LLLTLCSSIDDPSFVLLSCQSLCLLVRCIVYCLSCFDELLFIIRSEVGRFVKYTGYGNAAGLLAQRGLMCGGQGTEYSSESEDSDTDEYLELKEG